MLKIRCKMCNKELNSIPGQTKCCGCDNLTSIKDDKISALDLSLVELIAIPSTKTSNSYLTKEDLREQEQRRNRKVRKLEFEIK
jgi:formate dehydrogenase maturation protein FdhE